jgi:hypothetical protein
MNDRPTPETDALITLRSGFGVTDYEWRQHSRKLERQRDEARELARELRDALVAHYEEYSDWSIRGDVHNRVVAALSKAKEVLP